MTIKIPPLQAQMIGLCRASLAAAREYARGLMCDPDVPKQLTTPMNNLAAECSIIISRIDSRIPKEIWEQYNDQVVKSDSLTLENIKSLYIKMLPEQQEMLEKVATAILKKEFVIEGL
jgi:hypothetical protein